MNHDTRIFPGAILLTSAATYLYAQVGWGMMNLIDVNNGNRWSDTPLDGGISAAEDGVRLGDLETYFRLKFTRALQSPSRTKAVTAS